MYDLPKIKAAFDHVRQHHPEVTQVFYGTDQRWMYSDAEFNAPTFGDEIDIGLLEDAADAVNILPAAFSWTTPPDFKQIANELFDALDEVNQRLQAGLMGAESGRLAQELPLLIEKHECAVKDK